MMPSPHADDVSKLNQASTVPSSEVASPAICHAVGLVVASVAFSMSRIAAWPSMVLTFQVKVKRSRQ